MEKKWIEEKDVCPLLFYFLPFKEAIVSLLAYRSCTYTLYIVHALHVLNLRILLSSESQRSIFHSCKKKKKRRENFKKKKKINKQACYFRLKRNDFSDV